MKPVRRLSLLIPILLMVLGACSSNQAFELKNRIDLIPVVQPEPNFRSIHLFTLGTVAMEEGDYQSADTLLRMALSFDPNSNTIRSQIFAANINRLNTGQVTPQMMAALTDSLRLVMPFDETMLNQAFAIYNMVNYQQSMDTVLKEIVARFPTARSYISRYAFDFSLYETHNLAALQKALELGHNDLYSLKLLLRIYTELDPKKAVEVVQVMRVNFPSVEAEEVLIRLLFGLKDFKAARKLFASYTYPQDSDYMALYLDLALGDNHLSEIMHHKKKIYETKDRVFLQRLAAAASLANKPKIITEIRDKLRTMEPHPNLDSEIYAVFITEQLYHDKYWDDEDYGSRLFTVADADGIALLSFLRYTLLRKLREPTFSDEFIADFEARLGRLKNPILQDYLLCYMEAAVGRVEPEAYIEKRLALVKAIIARDMGDKDEYNYLLSHYYESQQEEKRLAMLELMIERYPDDAVYKNDLGYSYLISGKDMARAYELISLALELEPENPHYLDSIAWYYYLNGQPKTALENMQIPLQMTNMPSEIAFHIGVIYKELAEYDKAKEFFLKTLEAEDNFSDQAAEELKALKELASQATPDN